MKRMSSIIVSFIFWEKINSFKWFFTVMIISICLAVALTFGLVRTTEAQTYVTISADHDIEVESDYEFFYMEYRATAYFEIKFDIKAVKNGSTEDVEIILKADEDAGDYEVDDDDTFIYYLGDDAYFSNMTSYDEIGVDDGGDIDMPAFTVLFLNAASEDSDWAEYTWAGSEIEKITVTLVAGSSSTKDILKIKEYKFEDSPGGDDHDNSQNFVDYDSLSDANWEILGGAPIIDISDGTLYLRSDYLAQPYSYVAEMYGHVVDSQGMGINGLTIRITDYESFSKYTYTVSPHSYNGHSVEGYFYIFDILVTDTLYLEVYTHDSSKVLKSIPLSLLIPSLAYNSVSLPDIILAESPNESLSKYNKEIESTIDIIKDLACYPPLGDHDHNLPPEGDYDGDGISNSDEVLFYFTDPTKLTVPLYLSKGMNLYYFPSISDIPVIITNNKSSSLFYYYYDPLSQNWKSRGPFLKPNHFNVIYTSESGSLYLNLRNENRKPVLCLKGFSDPYFPAPVCSNPADCFNQDLFDPNYFDPNASTLAVLDNPNLTDIKTISTKGLQNGKWKSSYRFFGKPAGKVIHTKSYEVCLITKGLGGT